MKISANSKKFFKIDSLLLIVSYTFVTIPCPCNSTSTTSTERTAASSTENTRAVPAAVPASSSSSSSAEEQLAPSLLSGNGTNNGDPRETCVTCPQTLCSVSKLEYERKTMYYNMKTEGLPNYLNFLEKFQTPFEIISRAKFTGVINGNWTFTLARSGYGVFGSLDTAQAANLSQYSSNPEKDSPLKLSVMYAHRFRDWEIRPRLSFELWLSAHIEDEYVTLPSQISSRPMSSRFRSSNEDDEVTYNFEWSDIQWYLRTLIGLAEDDSQSVIFKFVINAYVDEQPSSFALGANCTSWNGVDSKGNEVSESYHHPSRSEKQRQNQRPPHQGTSYEPNPTNSETWPPFLHKMHAIVKDDKYTDLTVKSGDDEFQIHRVIAAYSSPVLATMIFNKTYENSESLLDFGEDIGSDVVEELIRYMYTGRVEDIEEIADRLIVAATKYEFPSLVKQCESVLVKQVKMENAFSMYELGAEVGSSRLKRRAFNIMKENKSKIVTQSEEFRKLSVHHPDIMYKLFLS